jgi:arginyl-tRNA synthetase
MIIVANKQGSKDVYYFIDTRDNAKTDQPFGITNADVAKKFKNEYAMGEGPFKPVDIESDDFQINRRDLQEAGVNETENQIKATEHNMEVIHDDVENSVYKEMSKQELVDELEARGLEYKKSGPESTNEAYIKQLVADDNK